MERDQNELAYERATEMMFGWQRTLRGVTPVAVFDLQHGCVKHVEFVGGLHPVKPEEQKLTLEELARKYPAPDVQPE
jgi:hypothetical protein